jgi:hypothetical protein
MIITVVTIRMSRKVSKNFESFGNDVELTANVADGENHEDVVRHLQKQCLQHLLKVNPFDEVTRRAIQKQIAEKKDMQK